MWASLCDLGGNEAVFLAVTAVLPQASSVTLGPAAAPGGDGSQRRIGLTPGRSALEELQDHLGLGLRL
jgi:hypothetical protein